MVLAVDAGHQMKKDKVVFICFNHYWWRDLCRVTSLGMVSLKVSMGLLKQRR
jgi:hypothetical protein